MKTPKDLFEEHCKTTKCAICKAAADQKVVLNACPGCGYDSHTTAVDAHEPEYVADQVASELSEAGFTLGKPIANENGFIIRGNPPMNVPKIGGIVIGGHKDGTFAVAVGREGNICGKPSAAGSVKDLHENILERIKEAQAGTNDLDDKVYEIIEAVEETYAKIKAERAGIDFTKEKPPEISDADKPFCDMDPIAPSRKRKLTRRPTRKAKVSAKKRK